MLELELMQKKANMLKTMGKVNMADTYLRAMPEYAELQKMKYKQKRVDEFIRLAKRKAVLEDSKFRNQM